MKTDEELVEVAAACAAVSALFTLCMSSIYAGVGLMFSGLYGAIGAILCFCPITFVALFLLFVHSQKKSWQQKEKDSDGK